MCTYVPKSLPTHKSTSSRINKNKKIPTIIQKMYARNCNAF